MPTPSEHKTVQARILAYAEAIGWAIVSREEAEQRRGLKESGLSSPLGSSNDAGWKTRAPLSLFFDDLLDTISTPTSTATGVSSYSKRYIVKYCD